MTTYYKSVRPDGTDFYSRMVQWADAPGGVVTHPDPCEGGTDAAHYLSVSTEPADCTGMGWPCRLLVVEPVEGHEVWAPHTSGLPHKRAATAWRVMSERPAHEALGPMGALVVELFDAVRSMSGDRYAAVAATGDATLAAWVAARDAAAAAARDAAGSAALYAALAAAGDAAGDAAMAAAVAARAVLTADLLTAGQFDALARPDLAPPAIAAVLTRARAHTKGDLT